MGSRSASGRTVADLWIIRLVSLHLIRCPELRGMAVASGGEAFSTALELTLMLMLMLMLRTRVRRRCTQMVVFFLTSLEVFLS